MLSIDPSRIVIRQGDLTPALGLRVITAASCCGHGEEPIDPALWSEWELRLYGLTTVVVPLTWDAAAAELVGDWSPGDTDVPGNYLGVLAAVETLSGLARTFPTADDALLTIVALPS